VNMSFDPGNVNMSFDPGIVPKHEFWPR
jgi:hypothetical protein